MTPSLKKRFWTEVAVTPSEEGFLISLDGHKVSTPAKAPLALPKKELAQRVASEWEAQGAQVDPATMPATRMANSTIDKVAPHFNEIAVMLAEYGGSDLLCYRAENPDALNDRQAKNWDPILDWASATLGAKLRTTRGVMHVAQPPESLALFERLVRKFSPFELTAFHDLVTISGSLILALALNDGVITTESAWESAILDELWQQEIWGEDEEALKNRALKAESFNFAIWFLKSAR